MYRSSTSCKKSGMGPSCRDNVEPPAHQEIDSKDNSVVSEVIERCKSTPAAHPFLVKNDEIF